MIVLGIDPGIESLGWALVSKTAAGLKYLDSGVKKTSKTKPAAQRLWEISDWLEKIIRDQKPDLVGLEKIFFSKNSKTALAVSEARGVALMLAGKHRLWVREFAPSEVKLALAGYGRADKASVAAMLPRTLSLPEKKLSDDESDALAIACCSVIHSGALQKN